MNESGAKSTHSQLHIQNLDKHNVFGKAESFCLDFRANFHSTCCLILIVIVSFVLKVHLGNYFVVLNFSLHILF